MYKSTEDFKLRINDIVSIRQVARELRIMSLLDVLSGADYFTSKSQNTLSEWRSQESLIMFSSVTFELRISIVAFLT
jgi:hypothetical protein